MARGVEACAAERAGPTHPRLQNRDGRCHGAHGDGTAESRPPGACADADERQGHGGGEQGERDLHVAEIREEFGEARRWGGPVQGVTESFVGVAKRPVREHLPGTQGEYGAAQKTDQQYGNT
ncbi:hypothetical protein [Streptomyces iconiensis]|uniref:Uncharacterized protein n=1 Tax=Streptomyces iconiensis TaxID=1384038 RepID=A0ABT6ZU52_9ACTN|nr:hypothetical protein [Streptomyces iconiensis]MDJ1132600.1 hypothetical protein [Streptomyces iconiensis]